MSVMMINDIEVGGTDDDIIAKVGTDQLTTQAADLSAAVNELNSKLIKLVDYSTTISNIAPDGAGSQVVDVSIPSGYIMKGYTVRQSSVLNRFIVWGGGMNDTTQRISIQYVNLRNDTTTATVVGTIICVKE